MPSDTYLSTIDFEKQQFVRCQTIGHAWFDYDSSDWKPEWGDPLVLRCERCGSERRDSIGSSGDIVTRSYHHPDGYSYAKGTKPSRAEFRRMMLEQKIREARAARKLKMASS